MKFTEDGPPRMSLPLVWTICDVDTEELEALDLLHYSPVDVDGGVLGPPIPVVHDQLLLS